MRTLGPVWQFLAWSINCLYLNRHPEVDVFGNRWQSEATGPVVPGHRFRLTEVRGDWKFMQETWGVNSHWRKNRACHRCCANKKAGATPLWDFREDPAWAQGLLCFQEFLDSELDLSSPHHNAILWTAGFDWSMLRGCSMHTVQLGCGLDTNGSVLRTLIDFGKYGPPPLSNQMSVAWGHFKDWRRANKVQCSQPAFKAWMLVSNSDDMCLLKSKVPFLRIKCFYYHVFARLWCWPHGTTLQKIGSGLLSCCYLVRACTQGLQLQSDHQLLGERGVQPLEGIDGERSRGGATAFGMDSSVYLFATPVLLPSGIERPVLGRC